MYDRNNSKQLLNDLLVHTFNIPSETVTSFVQSLEQSGEIELINQRISTLPAELHDALSDCVEFTSQDTSIDNMDLGDDSLDGNVDFYDKNVDPSFDEHEEQFDAVKDLLGRLSKPECGCNDSPLREYMTRKLQEMNEIEAQTTIANDSSDGIDLNTKKRIDALRASGNNDAADRLAQQANRKKIIQQKTSKTRTPLDNTISAQKRQLAQTIAKRNAIVNQGQQQEA